jgi:hypothetical protein
MIQGVRMKRSKSLRRSDRVVGNEEARVEMQSFLEALDSYPESFARDPGISFEQHCSSLMTFARDGSGPATQQADGAQEN